MESSIKFTILFLLLGTVSVSCTPEEDFAFETFLMIQVKNFSNWLLSKDLDPTPLLPNVVDVSDDSGSWNISGKMWNQTIFNHSDIWTWETEVKLDDFNLAVVLDFQEFSITGMYEVSGMYEGNAVNGSGNFDITAYPIPPFGGPYLVIIFRGFGVTSDGYVDLSMASLEQEYKAFHQVQFHGLSAGGSEDAVSILMGENHINLIEDWFPVAHYMKMFLDEIFAETPVSDIIGSSKK